MPEQKDFWLGAALAFASALCYAVYLVAGAEVVVRVGSVRFTAYAMTAASVGLHPAVPPAASARRRSTCPRRSTSTRSAMAVVSTAIPVFMTSEALRRVGANTVAIVGALGPVTTIAFGYLGLDEVMTPLQLLGSALVLVGVVVISLKPAARRGIPSRTTCRQWRNRSPTADTSDPPRFSSAPDVRGARRECE